MSFDQHLQAEIQRVVEPLRQQVAALAAELHDQRAELLTPEQCARRLNMSVGALRRAAARAARGRGRHLAASGVEVVRVGRWLRFRLAPSKVVAE